MKLSHKIILGFLVTSLLFAAAGIFLANLSQKTLEDTIGESLVMLASEILDKIDRDIYYRIAEFQAYSTDLILTETLTASNREFEGLENIQDYINKKDHEWTSVQKNEITPFMDNIISNRLSDELREKMNFHDKSSDYRVFAEIFATNRYGANVAQTGKTTDYRQDDEEWWQRTMKDRLYVKDIGYDESAHVYSLDFGVRIDDEEGNPLGVIKIVLSHEEITNIIKRIKKHGKHLEHKSMHYKLTSRHGRLIYSSDEFKIFEDVPVIADLHNADKVNPTHKGLFIYSSPGKPEKLVVHTDSHGYRDYAGLGWILIIEHDTEEVFAPVYDLKNNLLILSVTVATIGIVIGLVFSHSITGNIRKMKDASVMVSKGDLNTRVEIASRDELGQFADVFNQMVRDLKASRDNLALEIVERKRAENKQKKIADKLERSNSELQQFAYVASHDLREPLRMVTSYMQLLERRYKGSLDADADDFINYAVDGVSRMDRLILDLLSYSRVTTYCREFTLTDSQGALRNALDNLQIAVEENSAVVTYGHLPEVTGDETQLIQLFQNLIANAIKFSGNEAPRIHVSSEERADEWLFSVRDNGIGIEPEYYERIFGVFQRLHNNNNYPGTGIGLSVCKKIVERHGGRIWVESEAGNGSTFNFTINKNMGAGLDI